MRKGKKAIIDFLDSLSREERGEWIRVLVPDLDAASDPEKFYELYKNASAGTARDPALTREEIARKQREYYKRYYDEHRDEILAHKREYERANRERITYGGLRTTVKKVGARLGMEWLHAHSLRHYCATSLLKGFQGEKPLDLRWVQIHLGHARIETTTIYTHLSQKDVAEEVRKRYNALFRSEEGEVTEGFKNMRVQIDNLRAQGDLNP
ncbi:MAG: tyrosine-type recombinase/integrase [Thermoplasmata archaeon]